MNPGIARRLVGGSFPEYANLPLTEITGSGSSNFLYRLGEGLVLRFPRQPGGGSSIRKEARWLPLVSCRPEKGQQLAEGMDARAKTRFLWSNAQQKCRVL